VTAFLLDVNVLIALMDPAHIRHDDAHEWFLDVGGKSWATCPLTQNAVIRILGDARYPNSPGAPAKIVPMLAEFVSLPGHVFWPDDITMMDPQKLDAARLLNSRQVTDSYLLALAQAHGGQLATLDRRLVSDAVMGGAPALHVIQ